jgi:hypothetical protein
MVHANAAYKKVSSMAVSLPMDSSPLVVSGRESLSPLAPTPPDVDETMLLDCLLK